MSEKERVKVCVCVCVYDESNDEYLARVRMRVTNIVLVDTELGFLGTCGLAVPRANVTVDVINLQRLVCVCVCVCVCLCVCAMK